MSLKRYLSSTLNQGKKGNKRIGKLCCTLAICGLKEKVLSYNGQQPAEDALLICSWLALSAKVAKFMEGNRETWQSHGSTWDCFTFPYHHRHLSKPLAKRPQRSELCCALSDLGCFYLEGSIKFTPEKVEREDLTNTSRRLPKLL